MRSLRQVFVPTIASFGMIVTLGPAWGDTLPRAPNKRVGHTATQKAVQHPSPAPDSALTAIDNLEHRYRAASEAGAKALALCAWEQALTARIESGKPAEMVLTGYSPRTTKSRVTRCTLSCEWEGGGGEGHFSAQTESCDDAYEIEDWNPVLDSLPPGSILRFVGSVPFPLNTNPSGHTTPPGFLSLTSWTAWTNPDSKASSPHSTASVSVSSVTTVGNKNLSAGGYTFRARPAAGAAAVNGDPADPLAFLMVKDVGMVYLHGAGSVVLANGARQVFGPDANQSQDAPQGH